MVSLKEEIAIAARLEDVWPILSDPARVASCIPGAEFNELRPDGAYEGTISVRFGPTVAKFRGEAVLAYDHAQHLCRIEGRGLDQRGASRAMANGTVVAVARDDGTTVLSVDGGFRVTGPLETFANAGGVHLARALLREFAANIAGLAEAKAPVADRQEHEQAPMVAPTAAPIRPVRLAWRAVLDWLARRLGMLMGRPFN